MGNRVTDNPANFWSVNDNAELESTNQFPLKTESEVAALPNLPPGTSSRLFETNNNALFLRRQIDARYAQQTGASSTARSTTDADLQQRADKLSELFSGGGKRTLEAVAPSLQGLSETDAKQLRAIYEQKTGRDLLKDAANYLFMEDCFRAYQTLAPERIHEQSQPQAFWTSGKGIKMNPPTTEVLDGSQVEYSLDLSGEVGDRRVSHLIQRENGRVEEEGARFTGDYSRGFETDRNYRVTFQVRYGAGAPEFYTYGFSVKSATAKANNELGNLSGTAPDSDLYLKYLDGQIEDVRQAVGELETKRDQLKSDIQNGVGNSSDKYDELRRTEKQLETLKAKLPEMETARAEVANAFANGSANKPIPLKAVLIARENGQTIPLQLYAKQLGANKWAIVDVTNPNKPRTWTGEGLLPADALNQAWNNFVSGTNDLPAGQIAAAQPNGLGFQANKNWNSASSGQSTLKQWSNGLGLGSIALAALGGAALFGPGTQPAAVPLFLASGVMGGVSAGANLADRVNNGTFQWRSTETALDMLGIAGGVASFGGIGAMTGAGRTILANGAKYTVQNLGNFTRIAQIAEQGTNVAGGILIANQYVEAIDKVNRSPITAEQKAAATRDILTQAAAMGGLMVLGIGVSSRIAKASRAKNWNEVENLIGKKLDEVQLPEGYSVRQRNGQTEIVRTNANDTEFTPLSVNGEGRIQFGGADNRISNANTMNNNYNNALHGRLAARFGSKNAEKLLAEINGLITKHHILPDNVLQKTELGQRAISAGYSLDGDSNLIGLANKSVNQRRLRDLGEAAPNQPGHWTSHAEYDRAVINRLNSIQETLETKYGKPLTEIPDDVILREMKNLENEFRQKIRNGDVPSKDGRIALLPMISGRGEIRV